MAAAESFSLQSSYEKNVRRSFFVVRALGAELFVERNFKKDCSCLIPDRLPSPTRSSRATSILEYPRDTRSP